MTDADFKLLVTLFMVSDTRPLSPEEHVATESFLNQEAQSRGWKDWVGAYHDESKITQDRALSTRWVAVYGGGSTCPDGESHWPPHEKFPSATKCIRCDAQIRHDSEAR